MSKTETKSTVLVKHHLKQLKLPTMQSECEKTAARAAKPSSSRRSRGAILIDEETA